MATAVAISDIVARTGKARSITDLKVKDIQKVNANLRMLAFNALIEAKRVGELGAGFGVVADEVKGISEYVETLARSLTTDLGGEILALEDLTQTMARQYAGSRLVDLSLNAIELIDRNLYERTCDVRWWATDAAVVAAAAEPSEDAAAYAASRLGVILNAYTVYLDLWLCDMDGNVIANGRPGRYPVLGQNVADRSWFQKARRLASGDDYAVDDIAIEYLLNGEQVATYAASVRANGDAAGPAVGVLGVHFDWRPQAAAIVEGVRLTPDEAQRTRVMLVDAAGLVIASSDGEGVLSQQIDLRTGGKDSGFYTDANGCLTAFHRTPGYETYEGLGWHGVIIQAGG